MLEIMILFWYTSSGIGVLLSMPEESSKDVKFWQKCLVVLFWPAIDKLLLHRLKKED